MDASQLDDSTHWHPTRRRIRCLLLAVALLLSAALFTACGGDGGSENKDTTVDDATDAIDTAETVDTAPDVPELPDGPTVNYDYEGSSSDFYAFPYPNALRLNEDGAPDLSNFETTGNDLVEDGRDEVLANVRGFSPSGGTYFTFEEPIDPASLPQDNPASIADDASAYIINLEAGSPRFGQRHRAVVHFVEQGKKYVPQNMLIVRPAMGHPLHPNERYGVVLTRDINLATGDPVGQQPAWEELRNAVLPPAGYPDELHRHVRQLVADLEDAGVDTQQVLTASAFTVGDPSVALQAMFDAVESLPFDRFLSNDMVLREETMEYRLYEGTFTLADYMSGTPPFLEWGQGKIMFDDMGAPIIARDVQVRYAIMIPVSDAAAFFVVPVLHGSNGDYLNFTRNIGPTLAAAGGATISIDGTLSGARNPTMDDELHLNLAVNNIIGARDMVLQNVADSLQLLRFMEIVQIPVDISPLPDAIGFQTEPLVMIGHSFGAQTLALMLGLVPRLEAGVISEGGGGAALSLIQRKGNNVDIQAALGLALGLDADEPLDEDHPIVNIIAQPMMDSADPLNVAHKWIKEPIGHPKDVLVTLGLEDELTPPDTIRALGVAAGLPPVSPVVDPSPIWADAGLDTVSPPVSLNMPVTGAEMCHDRDPCAVTGGVISYNAGHSLIFTSDDARWRYLNFIASALNNMTTIVTQFEP